LNNKKLSSIPLPPVRLLSQTAALECEEYAKTRLSLSPPVFGGLPVEDKTIGSLVIPAAKSLQVANHLVPETQNWESKQYYGVDKIIFNKDSNIVTMNKFEQFPNEKFGETRYRYLVNYDYNQYIAGHSEPNTIEDGYTYSSSFILDTKRGWLTISKISAWRPNQNRKTEPLESSTTIYTCKEN
jgi:hypothetical protein